jgi:hypothetical protein
MLLYCFFSFLLQASTSTWFVRGLYQGKDPLASNPVQGHRFLFPDPTSDHELGMALSQYRNIALVNTVIWFAQDMCVSTGPKLRSCAEP